VTDAGDEDRPPPAADALHADLLRAGEDVAALRAALARHEPDDLALLAVLRRALPVRALELLGTSPPWSERRRVLGGVVRNPRAPTSLALRLVPSLFWRDLAEVAALLRIAPSVRARAEAVLKEQLPDLRLGDRITLARIATPALLPALLAEADARVVQALLDNPRLRESDLLTALRRDGLPPALIEGIAASPRWRGVYAVRVALVLQPRTPLPIALAQISVLVPGDLRRVASSGGLAPLLQRTARRLLGEER